MKNKNNDDSLLGANPNLENNKSDSAKTALESAERIDTEILKRNIEDKLKTYRK